jgi:hypothetical protein
MRPLLTSPTGTVLWAALAEPDHWGNYSLKLVVPTANAYTLGDLVESEIDRMCLAPDARRDAQDRELKLANLPYRLQPNGATSFNFKVRAVHDGEHRQPTVFDPEGQSMSQDRIRSTNWQAAVVHVRFHLSPFYTPVAGAGCSLRLHDVHVESFVVFPWEARRSPVLASLPR